MNQTELAAYTLTRQRIVNQIDDIETKGIKLFSELVKKNSSLQTLLLPIRDGLMMCRRI